MDSEKIQEIKEEMCDKFCKYPIMLADDEALMVVCNRCPLERLVSKNEGTQIH